MTTTITSAATTAEVREGDRCQTVRAVGCKRGYPYFARGLYEARRTCRGKLVWKLIGSSSWGRSESLAHYGRIEGVAVNHGARHNSPAN